MSTGIELFVCYYEIGNLLDESVWCLVLEMRVFPFVFELFFREFLLVQDLHTFICFHLSVWGQYLCVNLLSFPVFFFISPLFSSFVFTFFIQRPLYSSVTPLAHSIFFVVEGFVEADIQGQQLVYWVPVSWADGEPMRVTLSMPIGRGHGEACASSRFRKNSASLFRPALHNSLIGIMKSKNKL